MTKVFFREYYDRYLFEVSGHACGAPKGENLVCAAISVLVLTLSEMLKNEEDDRRLHLRRENISDGCCVLEIEPFEFSRGRTDAIIETILAGFSLLAEQYPEQVKLE